MRIPDSRIVSVTVYQEGALVTKESLLEDVFHGTDDSKLTEIQLGPIPMATIDGSLKVLVQGSPELKIPSFRTALKVVKTADTDLSKLRWELESAREKMHVLEAEKQVLQRSLRAVEDHMSIETRGEGKEGEPPHKIPVDARRSLIDYRVNHRERTAADLAGIEQTLIKSRKVIRDIEARIQEASSADTPRENQISKVVVASIERVGEIPKEAVCVQFSYYVPGARWVPSYALTFAGDYRKAELMMRASVAQATGEDWSNAKISLSTASWVGYSELPDLKALRIGRSQPEPPSIGWKPLPPGLDSLYEGYDRDFKGKTAPAVERTPVPELLSASFSIEDSFDGYGEGAIMEPCPEPCYDELDDVMECGAPPMAPCASPAPPPPGAPAPKPSREEKKERLRSAVKMKKAMVRGPMMTGGYSAHAMARTIAPMKDRISGAPGGGMAPPEPVFEPELSIEKDMLDYGSLVMKGPESSDRGTLGFTDVLSRYLLLPSDRNRLSGMNLNKLFKDAARRSRKVRKVSLPRGHVLPSTDSDFVYIYNSQAVSDVPSDSTWHTFSVLSFTIESDLLYIAVPRVTQDVFQTAHLVNSLNRPLPAGPCDVTVGSSFLLRTNLNTVAPKGSVEIGLGVEQGIKVIRNTTYSENEEGFISSESNLNHSIEIELKNNLSRDCTVEVRERIPYVPKGHDNITVTVESVTPPWQKYEQKESPVSGAHVWKVDVPAGEKKKLKADYVIEIPASYELVGGNRREVS